MTIGINSRSLDDLHPALYRGCRELMRRMNQAGFPHMGVSSTYRCNHHQDWLFEQGRSRPGNVVTSARGGQSIHNHHPGCRGEQFAERTTSPHDALAFDIFQNIRGQEWNNPAFFIAAGAIWMDMGGEWGGSWMSFPDRPHFQYTGGLTLRDLQNGRMLSQREEMPWERGRFNVEQRNFRILGQEMQIDAILQDGRTFAMIRPVLEAMGYVVTWEESTGTVVIDCPDSGKASVPLMGR